MTNKRGNYPAHDQRRTSIAQNVLSEQAQTITYSGDFSRSMARQRQGDTASSLSSAKQKALQAEANKLRNR